MQLPGGDSMPGVPMVPRWNGPLPYKTHHPEREAWGDRLLKAASDTTLALKACGNFVKFEGYTWCLKAMPADVAPMANDHKLYGLNVWRPKQSGYGWERSKSLLEERPKGSKFVALSFGIRDRDLWSQFISNRHGVPTKLYDCFWDEDNGPMGSKRLTAKAMGKENCGNWRDSICYGSEYEAKKTCISTNARTVISKDDNRTLKFETMKTALKGLKPLSAFLKVDIEGSEWSVLEQLLDSPEDMAKIRSLDMEVHLNKFDGGKDESGVMERKIKVMERLAKEFATVGSTIGHLHETLRQTIQSRQLKNPEFLEEEPQCCYTKGGFSLDQYMISYVNRQLLL